MLRIVLLGASGFVGSAVLRQLAGVPAETHVLVHRRSPAALPRVASVHAGAVTNLPPALLPDAPHVIVHCASRQIDDDGSGYGVNLDGIEHLCARVTPHTRAVLFLSSCSVYGDGPQQGVREDAPLSPGTELARSRAACEERLARLAAGSACRVEVFRPRFVLGRGDAHVLPGLARLARRGLTLGNGRQRFSVIDVDDFAAILLARARHALQSNAGGFEAFNVGYERPISLHEIQSELCDELDVAMPRRRIPVRQAVLAPLARLPLPALRRLVHRLQLLGLDHHGDVSRLRACLDAPWLARDPRIALRHAAQWLAAQPESREWTQA